MEYNNKYKEEQINEVIDSINELNLDENRQNDINIINK